MNSLSNWLSKHKYELMNDCLYKNKLLRIRDINNKSKKLLKVTDVSELDSKTVVEVVSTMNRINNLNIKGLMKYKVIEKEGDSLYRVMREYKTHLDETNPVKYFEENDLFEVLNGILAVIKSLRENGTIHSDLKPSNIFLNDENEVIISDYLENLLYKGKDEVRNMKIKDLCFVCIDELLGKELDILSDIWNFGLIFYYIMSGKYPFLGSNMLETLENIRDIKYTPLECEYGEDINYYLKRIFQKERKDRLKLNEVISELKKLNEVQLPVIPFNEKEINLDEEMKNRDSLIESYNKKPDERTLAILLMMKLYKEDKSIRDKLQFQIYHECKEGKQCNLDKMMFNIDTDRDDKDTIKINLSCLCFCEEGMKYFFRIMKMINPTKLDFVNIPIPIQFQSLFGSLFSQLTNLQELHLFNCHLSYNFIESYVKSFPLMKLKYVDLTYNPIGPKGFKILLPYLHLLINKINELNLSGMDLNDDSMILLSEELYKYPNLNRINIYGNKNIYSKRLKALFSTFPILKLSFTFYKNNKELLVDKNIPELIKYIKFLYLSKLEIDDDFFKSFFSLGLNELKEIVELDLSNNKLTYKSVELLINNLSLLPNLNKLQLYGK